jgi:Icc-related predicted phosphoesterase
VPDLLVGSDFHLGPLVHVFERRLAENVIPIFCGDLVNRPRDHAPAFFATLARWRGLNPDLVVVPGNHDPEDSGSWDGIRVVERRGIRILKIPVIPILYKIPTWTHEYGENTIAEMIAPFEGGRYDLVVSHAPPYGICDEVLGGHHAGSKALLAFADKIDFRLWLCGHVHEQRAAQGVVAGKPLCNAAMTILRLPLPLAPAERISTRDG